MNEKPKPRKTLTAHEGARAEDDVVFKNPTLEAERRRIPTPTEATKILLTQDPDKIGLLPPHMVPGERPSTVIYSETKIKASPIAGIPRAFTREHTEERTVIRGHNVEAEQPEPYVPPEATEQKLEGEVIGRATLFAAVNTPPEKKDGKKIIRG